MKKNEVMRTNTQTTKQKDANCFQNTASIITLALLICSFIFLLSPIFALSSQALTTPKKYNNVYDLFLDRNDYPPDEQYKDGTGQFRVLQEQPILHIEINPMIMKGDFKSAYHEETKRAILYGIYKTFIHTKIDKIKVTAIPMEFYINNSRTKRIKKKVNSFHKTITISRQEALTLIQKTLGVSSFTDLVAPSFYKETFIAFTNSDIYKNILYNGKKYHPGLDNFFILLERYSTQTK